MKGLEIRAEKVNIRNKNNTFLATLVSFLIQGVPKSGENIY